MAAEAKTESAISIGSTHKRSDADNPFEDIHKENLENVYKGLLDALDSVEKKLPRSKLIGVTLEIAVLLGLLACLAAARHAENVKNRRFLNAWVWEWAVLLLVVVSGLSVVRFLTYVACLPITRWWRWRIHRNLLFFVLRAKTNFDFMVWLALILAAWYTTVKPRLAEMGTGSRNHAVSSADHLITGLLIATALGVFLWLLKNLMYLKLESDLHYNQLFNRIHRTLTDFHVIYVIYGNKGWSFLFTHDHSRCQKKDSANDGFWLDVFQMEMETAPLWIVRRLSKGYLSRMEQARLPVNPGDSRDEQKLVAQAKAMLKKVIGERKDRDVTREDLRNVGFEENELSYVFKKMNMEGDEESTEKEAKITEHDFLSWAVTAYRSCWNLQRTLNSSKRVFIKLNRLMNGCVITIVLVIWLLLSQIVNTAQLALLFSPFLAASFIFGDSCKKMFEGLIFAFSIRPFDVGDRVVIDGMQMKVTELHILTSVFFKYDTQEEIVYPNSVLTTKSIANLDIVPDQADSLEFTVHRNTPVEDIKELELKIIKYLDEDDSDYGPSKVVKKALIGEKQIKMAVHFKYMVSYLAAECRAVRKSRILTKIIEFCKEMEDRNYNIRPYSSTKKPVIVEFTVDGLKLEQINEVKEDVMRCLEDSKIYDREYSKVVIKEIAKEEIAKEIAKEEITMALYLRQPLLEKAGKRRSKSVDRMEIKDGKEGEKERKNIEYKIEKVKHVKEVKHDRDRAKDNQEKDEIDQAKNSA